MILLRFTGESDRAMGRSVMDRRRLVALVAGTCLLQPLAVLSQPGRDVARIGLLLPWPEPTPRAQEAEQVLRAGLRELGWVEGRTLAIDTRYAGGDPQRQREVAAALKAIPVKLIVTLGTTPIRSARDGAPGVPIVMVNAGDAVGAGLVASLSRPGGDLTGTSASGEEILPKQIELLSAAAPHLKRIGVLMNSTNPANGFFFDAMAARAKSLGLKLERIDVAGEQDLDAAIDRAKGTALVVVGDPLFSLHRERVTALTLRAGVPAIYGGSDYVEIGGLMSYLSSNAWHWRRAAGFVDKILKGAKPAEIPVEQPTQYELVINLKTARALGLTIPPALLQRADKVIP